MSEASSWLDDEAIREAMVQLIEIEAAAVVSKYRTDIEQAVATLRQVFTADNKLRAAAQSTSGSGDNAAWVAALQRTRAYRDAVTAARNEVYQSLRRYHADDDQQDALIAQLATIDPMSADERELLTRQIAELHTSTRERLPDEAEFYRMLLREIGAAETLIDIGCGVQPLRFPFAQTPALKVYVAVDQGFRSARAVRAFEHCALPTKLTAICDDMFSGGTLRVEGCTGLKQFDVALMLKLVPVVQRIQRARFRAFGRVNAKRWIVTGSRQSMAKRRDIERRERGIVERFLQDSEMEIVSDFVIGEEFGYVAE